MSTAFNRTRTNRATEGDMKRGKFTSVVHLDSDDSLTPLSPVNNVLTWKIPRVLEDVKALKIQEFDITNTLSPFTEKRKWMYWTVLDVGGGTGTEDYSLDLSFEEYAFDRTNIAELGLAMAWVMNPPGGVANASQTTIEAVYDEPTDYLGFVLRSTDGANPNVNSRYQLRFYPESVKPLNVNPCMSFIFGLYEAPPSTTPGSFVGEKGTLGEQLENYSIDQVGNVTDYNAYVVWSNGALRLEGNNFILLKSENVRSNSTHSAGLTDEGKIDSVRGSNIMAKLNLGVQNGGLVRYSDFHFPVVNYTGAKSLSGTITFSIWHADAEKPRFSYNTPCNITLHVEYDISG